MESYDHLSAAEAIQVQGELKTRINVAEQNRDIKIIAGADVSLNLYSTTVYAGIILLKFPALQPIAFSLIKAEVKFPYVPGLLAFREVHPLMAAWQALPQKPDIMILDGHGIAHPRGMGVATHFGVLSGQATMGCAKKILCGKFTEPEATLHSHAPIIYKNETIGFAYRSKAKTAPVYVSPGHLMGMNNCLSLMHQCTGKYRVPEPTRLAHNLVNAFRKGELEAGYTAL